MMQTLLKRFTPLLVVALAGCAAPNAVPPGGEKQLLEDIKAGTVQLDCGLACMPIYLINQPRIQQALRNQDWPEMGLLVAKTSYRRDIAYFYLGAAAEGMGALAAADRYYRMAGALATGSDPNGKCASVQNLCGGFTFPRDIVTRLRAVSQVLGRAPLAANELQGVSTQLHRTGAADYIPDAPEMLLQQYAARRLFGPGSGNPRRDQAFANQLLEQLDPAAAQATAGNEIARPRALRALSDRLGNQVQEQRQVLGLWVQLRDYDLGSQSFELRYPMFSRARPPAFTSAVYSGASERQGPWNGYASRGTACVWERGSAAGAGDYLRPDDGDPYFALLLLCNQHPDGKPVPARLDAATAELPPYAVLQPPRGVLWPRLRVAEARAEAMVRQMGRERLAWAELVFDVRAMGGYHDGPFGNRELLEQRRPGMTVAVMPRALVVWETPPEPRRGGKVLAVAGDLPAQALALQGRLTRELVPDRSYEGQPEPVIADAVPPATATAPAAAAATAAERNRPAARPAPGATPTPTIRPAPPLPQATRPPVAPAAKPAKVKNDDDEDWVEPPPARR